MVLLIKTIFIVLITKSFLINYIRNVVYNFYVGDFIFLSILCVMLFSPLSLYSLINIILIKTFVTVYNDKFIWATSRQNLSSGVCEQQRRRPACAFAQSDQRRCYWFIEKKTSYRDLLPAKLQSSSLSL